jgi:hypothetical protein
MLSAPLQRKLLRLAKLIQPQYVRQKKPRANQW